MGAQPSITSYSNRRSELQAFDDTKAGVKGLVDAGVQKIPNIFVHPPDAFDNNSSDKCKELSIPIIDLKGLCKDLTNPQEIVDKVRCAYETFGFFQVINHGIPVTVLEEMLQGVHRFFDQDTEVTTANWRDTLFCFMAPSPPQPEELPAPCRDEVHTLYISTSTVLQVEGKLITNDRFKSVEHRVVSNHIGPRVSVACFFGTSIMPSTKLYGPIEELVSKDNPPKTQVSSCSAMSSGVELSDSVMAPQLKTRQFQRIDKIEEDKFRNLEKAISEMVSKAIDKAVEAMHHSLSEMIRKGDRDSEDDSHSRELSINHVIQIFNAPNHIAVVDKVDNLNRVEKPVNEKCEDSNKSKLIQLARSALKMFDNSPDKVQVDKALLFSSIVLQRILDLIQGSERDLKIHSQQLVKYHMIINSKPTEKEYDTVPIYKLHVE
ncbi:hypothetical protein AgCh_028921 [Apium graveolens]